ncbi:PQQ-binding-like beta-propeller repeat protein [Sphingomonas sp. FW199]|uniref:outer membrane protein assembly factor BamB family protein n=1 Tax=Sphingomonas sp. FW199 TaxID=3400217 RepID=UPI003CE7DC22
MKMTGKVLLAATALALLSGCGVFGGKGKKRTPVVGQRVPILVSENEVKADPTIAAIEILVPPAATNASWNQPGGNASKSMGHPALGQSLTRAWSVTIPGTTKFVRLAAAPVVADGRLYVMDSDAVVHAYAADTGTMIWSQQTSTEDANKRSRFGGGVSVDGGRVYATNGIGEVVAMDATNGAQAWRSKPGGPLRGAPTLANGNVYALSQDNQLFALSQADGSVVWTQAGSLEPQGVFGVAAPAVAQGTVVTGFSSGELNAYRYENGRSLWADTLSRTTISTSVSALVDIDAEPVIDQGRVYAVGQGGRMVAVEILNGQRLWEQNIGGIATPWVVGEWIFVVTSEARLAAVARANGKVRWITQLQRYRNEKSRKGPVNWVGPVLAGGRLILLNSRGEMAQVSPTDGSVISTTEADKGGFTLQPVVAGDTLYTLSDDGRLTAWR